MRHISIILLAAFGLLLLTGSAMATDWQYPIIKICGRIVSLPHAAVQPDKKLKYKVIFDIIKGPKKKGAILPGLFKVARLINVFDSAGMPPSKMDLVAVLHGPATEAVLKPAAYLKKHGHPNPDLKVIAVLKKVGVKLYVCGQALAEHKIKHADVNPDITIALSALTVVPTYQLLGYAYMSF